MISWFQNLKMQTKLLTLFSLITMVGALAIGWYIYTLVQVQQEVDLIVQEAHEIAEVEEVQVFLLEQQIAINDYRFTANEAYLVEYEEARELADIYLRQASVDAITREQRSTISEIGDEIEVYNRAFDKVIALHDAGDEEGAVVLAQEIGALEEERVQRIHSQIERFVYQETLAIDEQAAHLDQQIKQATAVGVGFLLTLSVLAIVAALSTSAVAEPILHLTNAVVAFENDTYEPALLESYLKRREELGQLARSFDSMASSITEATRTKDQLLNASSRFVPVNYLDFLQKPSIIDISLGDHVSAEMAVMFSDIRSFTTISEGMTPQENFDFVNAYLKRVSPVIQHHNGFVVKFLGDGMMAVFPYEVEDALKAGLRKLETVRDYNADRINRGLLPINLGVGIHTGHMMVGMIGEEGRMQGDAFSDNVNLTARIEGLTKFFGSSLIITAETLARIEEPGGYGMRPLGRVQVKGRDTPVKLYEVFDAEPDDIRTLKYDTLATYEEGLRLYTLGDLEAARNHFTDVLQANPDDKATAFYLSQTVHYITQDVLPHHWDGVIVMTSK